MESQREHVEYMRSDGSALRASYYVEQGWLHLDTPDGSKKAALNIQSPFEIATMLLVLEFGATDVRPTSAKPA